MEVRKLVKFGSSSHVLALPHRWLKEHNLNKGDLVYITENEDRELVLSVEKKKKSDIKIKEIYIDGKDIKRIKREIISAYLNNFKIMKIKGKSVSTKMDDLRNIIQNLFGLEILEQDNENVIAKDFVDLEEISLRKIVHKIGFIIKSMFSAINFDLKKKDCYNIINRDIELNRIYFLGLRQLKAILENPELTTVLKCSYKDLFWYWHVFYNLEYIADNLKGLSWFFAHSNFNKTVQKRIWRVYKKIKDFYLLTMKCVYLNDIEASYKNSNIKAEIQRELDCLLKKKNLDKFEIRIIDKLKVIVIIIHCILREIHQTL